MGNLSGSGMTLSDLPRAPAVNNLNQPIEKQFLQDLRNCNPLTHQGQFNERTMNIILGNLAKGCSLPTAVRAAGQVPMVVRRWLAKGMEQYKNLSQEEVDNIGDNFSNLPIECRFFLQVNQAMAQCTVEMQNILYEHSGETHNEWIAQWLLTVNEPEKYNIKYRSHLEDKESDTGGGTANVKFTICDATGAHSADEIKEINEEMASLKEQYKDQDTDEADTDENQDKEQHDRDSS